jgi:hypothetical protein
MYRGSLFVSEMGGTIEALSLFCPEFAVEQGDGRSQIPRCFAPRNDNFGSGEAS